MKVLIIGSGIAGRVAAFHFRGQDVTIVDERGDGSPLFMHNAVLRTKSDEIGLYLNSEMEKIWVEKAIYRDGSLHSTPTLKDKNEYSLKTTGGLHQRSISDLSSCWRYIFKNSVSFSQSANFIKGEVIAIDNNIAFIRTENEEVEKNFNLCITTAPMPVNMALCGIERNISFKEEQIYVVTADLNVKSSIHQTIYIPSWPSVFYRITVSGQKIIAEGKGAFPEEEKAFLTLRLIVKFVLGIDSENIEAMRFVDQRNGKIVEIDDMARKEIILELSHKHNVYSLGRYACWRPKLMIDDLPKDIKKIDEIYRTNYIGRMYESHNY